MWVRNIQWEDDGPTIRVDGLPVVRNEWGNEWFQDLGDLAVGLALDAFFTEVALQFALECIAATATMNGNFVYVPRNMLRET